MKWVFFSLLEVSEVLPFGLGLDVDRWGCAVASTEPHVCLWCSSLFQKALTAERSRGPPSQHVLLPSLCRCREEGRGSPEWQPRCRTAAHIPPWSHGLQKTWPVSRTRLWIRNETNPWSPVRDQHGTMSAQYLTHEPKVLQTHLWCPRLDSSSTHLPGKCSAVFGSLQHSSCSLAVSPPSLFPWLQIYLSINHADRSGR